MKWFITVIVAISVITSFQVCQAKEPVEFTTEFFKMVETGKISEAYDQLFSGSQIPVQKPQAVDVLKRQTSGGLPLYGKIIGLEKIREEKIGNSIIRLVYVLKMDLAPTVWEFYFYNPKGNWVLTNVMFNDQFNLLYKIE
ncbi:MAG: hypothetical protein CSA20_02210 [Deltaproteobacteria bacterium]|nr:MAG: hypothetical protein CSA20_02210 [Deltaproteobacteria bacterium]